MITLSNVSKFYKKWKALDSVDLKVNPGEFVFIVGNSGAGKSTLLKLLYMLEFPDIGEVEVLGISSNNHSDKDIITLRRQMGFIFQDFKLLPQFTVREQVEFVLKITGKDSFTIKERVDYALTETGLLSKSKSLPHQLSGGEAQRTAIARAIANNPKLILADEPTGNLDPGSTEDVLELLLHINSFGTAVFMVTHNIDLVDECQRRTIEIEHGKIIADNSKDRR